jgi:hypothetical protein
MRVTELVDPWDLAERASFEILSELRHSYDHHIYLVERAGERCILKTVADPAVKPNLRREIAYSGLLRSLTEARPELSFRVPEVHAFGDGWVVRELIDAPPIVNPGNASAWAYEGAAPRWARVFADFDMLASLKGRPSYRDPSGQPVATEEDRLAELERWVNGSWAVIPDPQRTLDYLRKTLADVEVGFEMWDVKAEDFLDLEDGRVGVYDLEFAHLFGRRYYDLAKLSTILCIGLRRPQAAARLLGQFAELQPARHDDLARALLPVIAAQVMGKLHDAVEAGDAEGVEIAQDLLSACLEERLDALLQTCEQ